MTREDRVLGRLAAISAHSPPEELSRRITNAGHARLVPARVHPLWSLAVAASVLLYLGWALRFTSQLY
jgi:type VI protein secretion system component VasF